MITAVILFVSLGLIMFHTNLYHYFLKLTHPNNNTNRYLINKKKIQTKIY